MIRKTKGSFVSYPDTGIADFHSHILPCIDDGSKSVEMTLEMLDAAAKQGIKAMVATPHFYPNYDSPDKFISRRAEAIHNLLEKYDGSRYPRLYVGAEVAYFSGMGSTKILSKLCIEGTRTILVEMPFSKWDDSVIDDLIMLKMRQGLFPVVAHIERYIKYQSRGILEYLRENDILIQSNAEFFLDRKTAKKAIRLVGQGYVNLFGSDSHNTTDRCPNLGDALARIIGVYGDGFTEATESLCGSVLRGAITIEAPAFTV